jgi:hypothetical protein
MKMESPPNPENDCDALEFQAKIPEFIACAVNLTTIEVDDIPPQEDQVYRGRY